MENEDMEFSQIPHLSLEDALYTVNISFVEFQVQLYIHEACKIANS